MDINKKEKLKRLGTKILWIIIGILLTEAFHWIFRTSDVTASFEPMTADNFGAFFPVKIINTGDKTLNKMQIKIKTCYMDDYRLVEERPILKKNADYTIRFWEEKTISTIPKKLCIRSYNFSFHNCNVDFYIVNSTTLYTPETECSIYLCDFCSYAIKIKSNEIKKEKEFTEWFIAPKEIKLAIKPVKTTSGINLSNLTRFSSPIGINFFIPLELCLYNKSCPFENISSAINDKENYLYKHLFHNLYPLNLVVKAPLNEELYNYRPVEFLINYTLEQEKEIMTKGFDVDDFEITTQWTRKSLT